MTELKIFFANLITWPEPPRPVELYKFRDPTRGSTRPVSSSANIFPLCINCTHCTTTSHLKCLTSSKDSSNNYLAHSTNLPTRLYILLALISFFFQWSVETNYIRTYWTDFYDFSPNCRHLFIFSWSGPLFWFFKGRCHGNQFWAKPLSSNTLIIWYAGDPKRIRISQFWFQLLIGTHFYTSRKTFTRFG